MVYFQYDQWWGISCLSMRDNCSPVGVVKNLLQRSILIVWSLLKGALGYCPLLCCCSSGTVLSILPSAVFCSPIMESRLRPIMNTLPVSEWLYAADIMMIGMISSLQEP